MKFLGNIFRGKYFHKIKGKIALINISNELNYGDLISLFIGIISLIVACIALYIAVYKNTFDKKRSQFQLKSQMIARSQTILQSIIDIEKLIVEINSKEKQEKLLEMNKKSFDDIYDLLKSLNELPEQLHLETYEKSFREIVRIENTIIKRAFDLLVGIYKQSRNPD